VEVKAQSGDSSVSSAYTLTTPTHHEALLETPLAFHPSTIRKEVPVECSLFPRTPHVQYHTGNSVVKPVIKAEIPGMGG
jgi:hypothetical protein